MKYEELRSLLFKTLANYAKDKEALANATDKTEIREDLKIKSARLVDVILDLETELNVEIEPDDMDGMFTIGEAMEVLKKYTQQG